MASPQRPCPDCEFTDEIISDLQHLIRKLRHELDNERVARTQRWGLAKDDPGRASQSARSETMKSRATDIVGL